MIRLLHDLQFSGAPAEDLQRQPAGFDLTMQTVSRFISTGALDLTNAKRTLAEIEPLVWPDALGEEDQLPLLLEPGSYLVTYNEIIEVPADCTGIVLPRSSLMRCGATLHSALWDPGYRGRGQGLLTVGHRLELYPNARIAQIVMFKLEQAADKLYSGEYQGENI
jgi:dUTP pyrophosphatase